VQRYVLYHHGILGQKWGKRNGPPYPLGSSKHSVSEKKAGWQKSLDSKRNKSYNKTNNSNDDNATATTALATYGTSKLVKSKKLDNFINVGKNKIKSILKNKSGNADNVANGLKKLSTAETLSDTISKTNPHLGNSKYDNNCSACGIAGFLRCQGYDVTAGSTGREMQNMGGVVEECFKGAKVFDGSATKFGRSRNDAAEMLLKRFGDNAEGVCSVQWKNSNSGHIFNWDIKDGKVSFFDAQNGWGDDIVSSRFWRAIDSQGNLQIARLDGLDINFDEIKKYVE
jgi:hypothetical protein